MNNAMQCSENLLTGVFVRIFAEDALYISFAVGLDSDEKPTSS